MKTDLYSKIDSNKNKTWLIMLGFVIFFSIFIYVISYLFADPSVAPLFLPVALLFSTFSSIGSYYYSDKIVLSTAGAKEAGGPEFQQYRNIVTNLSMSAGLPTPKCYYITDTAPNAFATGRDPEHGVICVTTGLIQKLNRAELEGVIAHELSHIKNFDIRLMSIVAVLVGSVVLIADWALRSRLWGKKGNNEGSNGLIVAIALIFAILTPLVAQIIQLAISRNREFLADASGAYLTRYPKGLADALVKISADTEPLEAANRGTAHMYIANPFKGKQISKLFATHPPVEERIKKLMEM